MTPTPAPTGLIRPPTPALACHLTAVRAAVHDGPEAEAHARVAAVLRRDPLTVGVLGRDARTGHANRLAGTLVHAEDAFSIVALAVRPGQRTTIHDHLSWCVVTVVQGSEQETLFRDHGDHLQVAGHQSNETGSVTAFRPPGDIHLVANDSATTAVSVHVYGVDLRVLTSGVRRTYDLPVRDSAAAAGVQR